MGRTKLLDIPDDGQSRSIERVVRRGFRNYVIGAGLGFTVGGVVGIAAGESLNEYIGILKEAPMTLQYAVDGGLALLCGFTGARIGAYRGGIFTARSV